MKKHTILTLLFAILFISCNEKKTVQKKAPNKIPEEFSLSTNCKETPLDTLISNSLFKIGYSKKWITENQMPQGIDISWTNNDSIYFGFMLSVVPYKDIYFKKNKFVTYKTFKKTTFKGYEGIYLMRNDLFKNKKTNTVYWRGELKLRNTITNTAYLLVFGSRSSKNTEPEWCHFSTLFNSFTIINE